MTRNKLPKTLRVLILIIYKYEWYTKININLKKRVYQHFYTQSRIWYYDDNMYLTVNSLIEINNSATGSNNIILKKYE